MEQRHAAVDGPALQSPALHSRHADLFGLQSSVEAHERRKATEDLEAFLRTTLQQAQASPEWSYANLPPTGGLTGIVSTPSWTAVIPAGSGQPDSGMSGPSASASGLPGSVLSPPTSQGPNGAAAYAPFSTLRPPVSDPFAGAGSPQAGPSGSGTAPGGGGAIPYPSASTAPLASPSFPPNATIFSDLNSALSSAPPVGAPPAFFSSYGMYQPVIAPYPRFLTPSPEPSVLGDLELELGPSAGEFVPNGDGLDEVWKDLEERDTAANGADGPAQVKKDPFEGMTLAQMRSRANSLEAVDRAASKYNPFESSQVQVGAATEEVRQAAQSISMGPSPPSAEEADAAQPPVGPGKKGKRKANGSANVTGASSKKNRAAAPVAAPPPAAVAEVIEAEQPDGSKPVITGRKNRNPHSTQLPGPRRLGKIDGAEDGHEGPICSHCGSVTTPLWRRGPDDELLCNACGLYLKLHGKARPKTFGKSGTPRRTSAGAAAQAAASGVPPSCNNCGATSTPMWRKDAEGNLCCNACSLYYKLHKVNRPASLAQKRAAAAAAKANALGGSAPSSTSASPQSGPSALTPIAPAPAPQAAGPPGPSPSSSSHLPTPGSSNEVTPASNQGTPASAIATPAAPALSLPPAAGQAPPPPPAGAANGAPPPNLFPPPGFYPPPGFCPPPFQHQQPMWPPHPFAPPTGYPFPALPPQSHPPPTQDHSQPHQQHQQQQQQQPTFALPPAGPPISPHQLPATPFAQTAWGQLAYGIVAAAAEEAHTPGQLPDGSVPPPPPQQGGGPGPGPGPPNGGPHPGHFSNGVT
ncbi:hypothetical protein JCM8202v2_001964 [Rhodotorula sphaerocarpa]